MSCALEGRFLTIGPPGKFCISFSCLIAMARTSNTMLNRNNESRQLCLIPEFSRKAFSFLPLSITLMGFPGGSEVKASASNVGDPGSIPGLGRSPGEGNGNSLQYSCLENPMDGGAW